MNIIKALTIERAKLTRRLAGVNTALAALTGSQGRTTKRRKTYAHSAATKKRLSIAMRRRWKEKKAKAAKN